MASRSLAPVSPSRSRTPAFPMLMDPFRLMDSLLSDVVGTRGGNGDGNDLLPAQPRMNIEDTGNEIRVTAELPGVSEDDVEITLDDDMLIIAGEKRDEREVKDRDVRLVERVFGQFRRAVQLPFSPNPDQVDAHFRDGVLTITVPKNAEQKSKQRHIEVKRDEGQGSLGSRSAIGSSSATSQRQEQASTTGNSASSASGQGTEGRQEREKAEAAT
jgi:HSP20 family protein